MWARADSGASMMRVAIATGLMAATLFVCGCGCGDRAAIRQLQLTEMFGSNSGPWGPIEVDLSQLPPGAVKKRVEKEGTCGAPITELQIFPNHPIKVVIMPKSPPK